MDRRKFLATGFSACASTVIIPHLNCGTFEDEMSNPFPHSKMPDKLLAVKIDPKMNWHEKNFLTALQGLINRRQARVYLLETPTEKKWLDYYHERFGIPNEMLDDPFQLLEIFGQEINGYIVYNPAMLHSLNNATTLGGIKNAIPVSPQVAEKVESYGLKKVDDLRGRWADLYEAYEWALDEFLPKCNQNILAELCVHLPHWPTSTYTNRDYVIANKILSVDISSSERDKHDYELLRKIYTKYDQETIIIGWHCVRDKEHEAVALASEFGHYSMCSLRTSNMTVHSSIKLERRKTFKQRTIKKKDLKVEDKVYIAYMATDGDAAWFMLGLLNTDWANPLHGSFKYNWGFLPLAYHLLPATVRYYLENMKPNDYFVAGPAGATYTYPHLHPDPRKFLRLTKYYMEKCGLTTVHMTNWNDRDWWQEVDLPEFPNLLRQTLPNCVGYVRGMGESAFEKNYIAGGKPYIFCGEAIHRNSDVYQTMKDFIDACPKRPLFIYNLVNHSVPMDRIKEAMDRFPKDQVELVHLDELLLLIEKAFEEGKITEELYPELDGVLLILAKEAKKAWPKFYDTLADFTKEYENGEAKYVENLRKSPIGLENIVSGEILAFTTIWHGMLLVKLALESQRIYVNYKPRATKDFLERFASLPDAAIVDELQKLWNNWHQQSVSFSQARHLADRLVKLAEAVNKIVKV